jgi:hypothetical protein
MQISMMPLSISPFATHPARARYCCTATEARGTPWSRGASSPSCAALGALHHLRFLCLVLVTLQLTKHRQIRRVQTYRCRQQTLYQRDVPSRRASSANGGAPGHMPRLAGLWLRRCPAPLFMARQFFLEMLPQDLLMLHALITEPFPLRF